MTTVTAGTTGTSTSTPSRLSIVAQLGRQDARRMLRHPLLALGVGLSLLVFWDMRQISLEGATWSGEEYDMVPIVLAPTILAIAVIVAMAFHREREPIGPESPTHADVRVAGILAGALPLVLLVVLMTLGLAGYLQVTGGLPLGDEPGRTEHARFTLAQNLQLIALAVLGVASGAAAGRRLRHRATAALVLFAGWFPTMFFYWMFQASGLMPFSIMQTQPVSVEVGPPSLDPTTLPESWLLSAPNEYQDHWARLVVSDTLAAWHNAWLIGLACLFLGLVLSGPWRRRLLVAGGLLAFVSVAVQFAVMP